eukprot:scaffold51041_cov36-Tisochrysis_lutea.AAC.1
MKEPEGPPATLGNNTAHLHCKCDAAFETCTSLHAPFLRHTSASSSCAFTARKLHVRPVLYTLEIKNNITKKSFLGVRDGRPPPKKILVGGGCGIRAGFVAKKSTIYSMSYAEYMAAKGLKAGISNGGLDGRVSEKGGACVDFAMLKAALDQREHLHGVCKSGSHKMPMLADGRDLIAGIDMTSDMLPGYVYYHKGKGKEYACCSCQGRQGMDAWVQVTHCTMQL